MEHSRRSLETIKAYVEAAGSSSDRGRKVLLVMITISVLAFAAYWNSRQDSWVNSRLHTARVALKQCEEKWGPPSSVLPGEVPNIYPNAKRFYELRHFESCENLKTVVSSLAEIQTQHVNQVRVPFFGVQFDVNDLGMFSGFAFVVALVWFYYSLRRELGNLELCYAAGQRETADIRRTMYDLLAMRQVMTVPAPLEKAQSARGMLEVLNGISQFAWGKLTQLLYLLPFLVQFFITRNDFLTPGLGDTVSAKNRVIVESVEGISLVCIGLLTGGCLYITLQVDQKWARMASKWSISKLSFEAAKPRKRVWHPKVRV